jgi:hypothetical protein
LLLFVVDGVVDGVVVDDDDCVVVVWFGIHTSKHVGGVLARCKIEQTLLGCWHGAR